MACCAGIEGFVVRPRLSLIQDEFLTAKNSAGVLVAHRSQEKRPTRENSCSLELSAFSFKVNIAESLA